MIHKLKLIILIHLCFIAFNSSAGEVITNNRLEGSALFTNGAKLKVIYDKYLNLPYPSINPFSLINSSKGMIEVGIDETKKVFHATNFTSVFTINYVTKNLSLVASTPQVKTLIVNYFPKNTYTAQTFVDFNTVSEIEITSISVQSYFNYLQPNQSSIANPSDLYIEASVTVDETLTFDFSTALPLTSTIGFNKIPNVANPNEIEAFWNYLPGAEEYELEYIYVDDYSATAYSNSKSTSAIEYDFEHDATRIITHNQYYRIPMVYERGWVIFRVRGIGKSQTNNNVRLEGTWSNAGFVSGTIDNFITAFPNQAHQITSAHENDNINWASVRTFAENGKSGIGISYEDGLLKNRQSVAKLNTEDKTIVQTTLYDWHGRPAVSILPTPFADNFLSYKLNLNKTTSGAQFDKTIFDNNANYPDACNPTGLTIDPQTSTGAANYYSAFTNLGVDAQQALVPDAQGLPYVQVDYYPDQTGRVKRQSLPGGKHFLGSGKENKIFYTQPTQEELVRLFGTEVGVYTEYEKQIDVDPNGQKSVTYTDDEGRTIATGLMGAVPSNLIALADATNPLTQQQLTTTLINNNNDPSQYVLGLTNSFYSSQNETQEISYTVDVSQYTDACLPSMCLDCIYELEISIKDDCGQELLDGDLAAGNQPVTKILGRYNSGATPEFPTTCVNPNPALHFSLSPSPFTFVVPKDGTYHLTKVLRLSTKPLLEYADAFVKNNTCLQTLTSFQQANLADIDISACETLDCAQCSTAVTSFVATLPPNTLNQSQINDLLAKCDLKCNLTEDICSGKEYLLLKDFKPGGYFAKTTTTSANYNLSIFNPNNTIKTTVLGGSSVIPNQWYAIPPGNPTAYGSYTTLDPSTNTQVAPNQLSAINYMATYTDDYAKPWLKFHPEFCRLQYNCDPLISAINTYTQTLDGINSFDDACKLGYLYPLPSSILLPNAPNVSTCSSCAALTNHYNPLVGFSNSSTYFTAQNISDFLTHLTTKLSSQVYLDQNNSNPSSPFNIYEISIISGGSNVNDLPSSIFGGGCHKDRQWLMFKRIYLAYIAAEMTALEISYVNTWNPINGGCKTSFPDPALPGYFPIFPNPALLTTGVLSGFGNGNSSVTSAQTAASTATLAQCVNSCHAYVNSWINDLSSCSISATDMPLITAALEKVCTAGCDEKDPFGASNSLNSVSISLNNTNTNFANVTNFQDVLNAFGYLPNGTCNAYVINAPKPKGHSYSGSTAPLLLDACGCDAILNAHASYTAGIANNSINACIISETEYVNQQLGVSLPYLSSYVCACKDAFITPGNYNFSTITLNDEIKSLPLPKEIACKNCINCGNIARLQIELPLAFPGIPFASISHVALTNYLNGKYNMNNTYEQWVTFFNDCNFTPPVGWTNSAPFNIGNTSQQAIDLKHLFQAMYNNNFFVANTSLTPHILTPSNAPAFFSSSLWNNSTLIVGSVPSVQLVVTNPSSGFYNLTLSSTVVSPAYNLSINIGDIPLGILSSPSSQLVFSDIYAFCESGLFSPNGRKQFNCLINYIDPLSSLPTSFYLQGGNSGTNSFSTYSPTSNLPPAINNKDICSAYLCSNSLSETPPPNSCITILINNALNTAQTQYNTYIAAQVNQFLANYKNYCYGNVTEVTKRKYLLNEYHYTLYYYDRSGNLVHTVPPAGVIPITNPATILSAVNAVQSTNGQPAYYPSHSLNSTVNGNITSYISHNQFNTYDAPTTAITPDGGETNYYYDHVGRLAVSQNSKQQAENKFSYVLYDDLGRMTEVGVFGFSTAIGDVFTPSILKDPEAWKLFMGFRPKREVTQTFYDNTLNTTSNAQFVGGQKNLRNRVSATTYELLYDNDPNTYDYASFYNYDDHGQVDHIVQHNPQLAGYGNANAYKHIEYEYELISSNVTKVSYQKGERDQWFHKYQYDIDNRLHAVYTSDNDDVYQRDAKYFYYQHGPMARTELGEKQVQGTDYAFTLQGWVKGVNSTILNETNDIGKDGAAGNAYMSAYSNLHKDFAIDGASFSLNYYNNDYNPIKAAAKNFLADMTNLNVGSATGFKLSADAPDLYNGNISSMVTSIIDIQALSLDKGKAKPQVTGYQYDQLNRLKHMKAFSSLKMEPSPEQSEAINLNTNQWITPNAGANYVGLYEMDLNYDKLGNIQNLTRQGDAQYTSGGGWQSRQMDNLTYNYNTGAPIAIASLGKQYTATNRLAQVVDNVNATNYGSDIDGTHDYEYNEIGSLKKDSLQQIRRIDWTDAHKVKAVIRTITSDLADVYFTYDGMGRRITKTLVGKSSPGGIDPLNTKTTHYVLDAIGNNMAIYQEDVSNTNIKCVSRTIFGSDRLGLNNKEVDMSPSANAPPKGNIAFGDKEYELKNHLGNVLTTISDRKLAVAIDLIYSEDFETCTSPCGYFGEISPPTQLSVLNIAGNNKLEVSTSQIYDGSHFYFPTIIGHTYKISLDVSQGALPMGIFYAIYPQQPYGSALTGGWINYGSNTIQFTATTIQTDLKTMKVYNNGVLENYFIDNVKIIDLSSTNLTVIDHYNSEILSTTDYYAFGSPMPGRQFVSGQKYRYGFQNQEEDPELWNGAVAFEYRVEDPRLGRFFSVDPLSSSYPWNSPYAFSENRVTNSVELEGLEAHDLYASGSVNHTGGEQGPQPQSGGTINGPYANQTAANDAALSGKAEVTLNEVPIADFKSGGTISQGHTTTGQMFDAASQMHMPGTINFGRPVYEMANSLYRWKRWVVNRDLHDLAGKNHGVNSAINNSLVQTVSFASGPLAAEINAIRYQTSLYHYTTEAGYNAIMESKQLLPSTGFKNARYGDGQYFTDIAPGTTTSGQLSARLFRVPWNQTKLTHYVEINTTNLNIMMNKPYNFLNPSSTSLDVSNKIISGGKSTFLPKN